MTECVVYKAAVTHTQKKKEENLYIELTKSAFKTRYNLHKSAFKLEHKRSSTTPSEHVWDLKKKNIEHTMNKVVNSKKKGKPFTSDMKFCSFCLGERKEILTQSEGRNRKKERILVLPTKETHSAQQPLPEERKEPSNLGVSGNVKMDKYLCYYIHT